MARNNLRQHQIISVCFFLFIILILGSYLPKVESQVGKLPSNKIANGNTNNTDDDLKFPDNGAPTGRRRGGTSRIGHNNIINIFANLQNLSSVEAA